MKKFLKFLTSSCTVLGALVLIILVLSLCVRLMTGNAINISKHSMLVINFADSFSETANGNIIDEFLGKSNMSFPQLIKAIDLARTDERIDGIVARIDISGLELAQIQDVARAIMRFRQSGKKTVAFSQGFGPFGQGNREYYLASFFEKIYMQPHTTIGLTGIGIEVPFARDVLDKIGVTPEYYTRYEYKSAMMSFSDKQMSAPYRENMTALLSSLMAELKEDISTNRELSEDLDKIINRAPLSAEEGKRVNLIDDLLYLPELEKLLKKEGIKSFVALEDYLTQFVPNEGNLPTIAVLNLSGVIDVGESSSDIDGEFVIGSQSVTSDLCDIEDLDNLRALVVRIDSPGGSYNAADEIYFALKDLQKRKKIPIIISQGGYAASGGYFISLAGDVILAEPTTITGSIGVLGGKFVMEKLWKKLGVTWTDIKFGQNADILSLNKPFSERERAVFNQSLDEVYADFTAKVEQNRKLKENIDKIARGRVWSGRQALELGLVDEMGGLEEALLIAQQRSNIKPRTKIKLVTFPQEKSFSDKIKELIFSGNIRAKEIIAKSGVDIRYLKLFKRLQYDTVLLPFVLNM